MTANEATLVADSMYAASGLAAMLDVLAGAVVDQPRVANALTGCARLARTVADDLDTLDRTVAP